MAEVFLERFMNNGIDSVYRILVDLESLRERKAELLSQMSAVLDSNSLDLPAHTWAVIALAKEVFAEDMVEFLVTPHRELEGETPIQVAQDAEGAKCVEELLQRILYGIPA